LLTKNLCRTIGESQRDLPATNDSLRDQLLVFVNLYRLHMQTEEEHFFPLVLKLLSIKELAEIDFTLFNQPRFFSQEMEDKFVDLHAAISKIGIADKHSTYRRDEATWLANFHDVAAFNEEMRASGERVHLCRSGDGYELECEGQVRVHIPECSEARATWCAYFFWKATTIARVVT
jgi:hypothetical protein